MALQLAEEVAKNDTWSAIIQQFNVAKLTEQLALNAAFSRSGKQVVLNLRSGQSHLHNERTHNELQNELSRVLGDAIELSIEVGELGQTPLELREARYQEKLAHAYQQLSADPNVNFIQTRFNAELDQESVRPL
jgi:DNA polymerase-3 subunit gamma/tau